MSQPKGTGRSRHTGPDAQQGSSRDIMEARNDAHTRVPSALLPAPRAKRKRITPEQQEVLMKILETTDTPNLELREQLSGQIHMTPREIQVYFQNQRAKRRRLAKAAEAVEAAAEQERESMTPETANTEASSERWPTPALMPSLLPRSAEERASSPAAGPMRRPTLRDLLTPEPGSSPEPMLSPASERSVRLPPLREVFPELLQPLPMLSGSSGQLSAFAAVTAGERPSLVTRRSFPPAATSNFPSDSPSDALLDADGSALQRGGRRPSTTSSMDVLAASRNDPARPEGEA